MPETVSLTLGRDAAIEEARELMDRTQGCVFPPRYLRDCIADHRCHVVAAFAGDTLAGIACARSLGASTGEYYQDFGPVVNDIFAGHAVGSLESLSVLESLQGQGIGTALTIARLTWLRNAGCTAAVGISWVSGLVHTSRKVFERLGFEMVGEAPRFFAALSIERAFVCPSCGGPPCSCPAIMFWCELGAGDLPGLVVERRVGRP